METCTFVLHKIDLMKFKNQFTIRSKFKYWWISTNLSELQWESPDVNKVLGSSITWNSAADMPLDDAQSDRSDMRRSSCSDSIAWIILYGIISSPLEFFPAQLPCYQINKIVRVSVSSQITCVCKANILRDNEVKILPQTLKAGYDADHRANNHNQQNWFCRCQKFRFGLILLSHLMTCWLWFLAGPSRNTTVHIGCQASAACLIAPDPGKALAMVKQIKPDHSSFNVKDH